MGEILRQLDAHAPVHASYPRSVVNRFIGRGVKRAVVS